MAKTYTAQDMRELANELESRSEKAVCRWHEGFEEWLPLWQNPDDTILALRQAADDLEREEKREKKYEYAEMKSDGRVVHIHEDKIEDVMMLFDGSTKVRREVSEWEEVKE